jgi:predicted AAA+ superfamily ATPase
VIPRQIEQRLRDALTDTPAVLIHGPRQSGKSTLGLSLGGFRTVTLDDPLALAFARRDPAGFLDTHGTPLFLDEVQRAPEVLLPMKQRIDRDRTPGSFLLTGSANVLTLPKVADSLAGRLEVLHLEPLSEAEIASRHVDLYRLFFQPPIYVEPESQEATVQRVLRGGFPEVLTRARSARRSAWFENYVRALLDRDIRDLAQIEAMPAIPRLLEHIARRSGQVMNAAGFSAETGIPYTSLKRYLALLEAIYLVRPVPAWASDPSRKLAKSPKLFVTDSGLACHLAGTDERALAASEVAWQQALQTFVASQLLRLTGVSDRRVRVHHLRTVRHLQVDFVLVSDGGEVAGVQVVARPSVVAADFEGLRFLKELAGPRFVMGTVLYLGDEAQAVDENIWTRPVSSLWT